MVSGVFVLPGGDSPEPKTHEAVSTSGMQHPGARRLLPRSQAPAQGTAQRRQRRLAPAVSAPRVGGRSPAPPAPAGAVLPGVRQAWPAHPGHGRGPYSPPQGRLGPVHGPEQPAIPVPLVPQPQNPGRNAAKITADLPGRNVPESGTLGRTRIAGPCAAIPCTPPPGALKFWGRAKRPWSEGPRENLSPRR